MYHQLRSSLQFPDIVQFCEDMANLGKTVIVAALDGTFQRKVGQHSQVDRATGCRQESVACPPLAIRSDSGAGALCRECGEVEGCVHGVLPRGSLHQTAWL